LNITPARTSIATVAFLFVTATTSQTDAKEVARLEWSRDRGAESCVSREELETAIEVQLGRSVFGDVAADLLVEGRVNAVQGGFRAVVRIRARGARATTRTVAVRGTDCRALDDALVLVVSVAMDPLLPSEEPRVTGSAGRRRDLAGAAAGSSSRSGEPSGAEADAPAEAPANDRATENRRRPKREASAGKTKTVPEKRASAADRDRESPEADETESPARDSGATLEPEPAPRRGAGPSQFALAGGGAVSAGLMPAPAVGGILSLAWRPPFFASFELGAEYFPFGLRPTSAGDAAFRAAEAEFRVCPRFTSDPVRVDACGLFSFGVLHAEGRGFTVANFNQTRAFAQAGAALRGELPIAHGWFARLGVAVAAPFPRDTFVLETAEGGAVELHRLAPVTVRIGAEVGFVIGS
jgi:hypothetical protein